MNDKEVGKKTQKLFNIFTIIMLSVMVLLIFVNAVLRYTINVSIPEAEEYARFAFVWTIFLGIIVAYKDGEHVEVSMFVDSLKGVPLKLIKVIARIITFFGLGVILFGGIMYTKHSSTFETAATGTNFALISIAIVIMAAGMIFLDLQKLYNSFRTKIKLM